MPLFCLVDHHTARILPNAQWQKVVPMDYIHDMRNKTHSYRNRWCLITKFRHEVHWFPCLPLRDAGSLLHGSQQEEYTGQQPRHEDHWQHYLQLVTNPVPLNYLHVINSYSASHDNWCTATLWNRIMTAQCEGMGEVGSARYEPAQLLPCPSIRVLSYSNCQEIHSRQQTGLAV